MTKKSTKTNKPSEKTSIDKEIADDNFEIERFASVINLVFLPITTPFVLILVLLI